MQKTILGKVLLVPRGTWQHYIEYERLNIVEYDGSSFIVLRPVLNEPPVDDQVNYMLFAQKGDQGDPGVAGQPGEKGDKGDPGEQGIKGDQGDKGAPFLYADFTPEQLAVLKGDKGDRGADGQPGDKGDKGDKGDRGEQGIKGDKGEKGDPGSGGGSVSDESINQVLAYMRDEFRNIREQFAGVLPPIGVFRQRVLISGKVDVIGIETDVNDSSNFDVILQ